MGSQIRAQFRYYPAVSRAQYSNLGQPHHGRLPELLLRGQLTQDLALSPLNPDTDRAMICGSPKMLADFRELLDAWGFHVAARIGAPGSYVFERAFVEK